MGLVYISSSQKEDRRKCFKKQRNETDLSKWTLQGTANW